MAEDTDIGPHEAAFLDLLKSTDDPRLVTDTEELLVFYGLARKEIVDATGPINSPSEPPRVKLIPLQYTWVCPKCMAQNRVVAYQLNETGICYTCNTEVTLGERRKGDKPTLPNDTAIIAPSGEVLGHYDVVKGEIVVDPDKRNRVVVFKFEEEEDEK